MNKRFDGLKKPLWRRHDIAVVLAGIICFLIVPMWLDDYLISVLILIFLYVYLGACWNLIGGYAGQFSFGHAAFYGMGGYISSMLFVYWGISPWIGMLAGGVLTGLFSLGSGFLSFRYGLRGPFFALVTLAYAEMLRVISNSLEITGGAVGLFLPLRGNSPLEFQFEGKLPYYYIIFFMSTGVLLLTRVLEKSKTGFYLRALRVNENSAEAVGVNVFRYKLFALTLSGFLTALAGTFYAQYFLFIDPIIMFGTGASIEILIRPVIGGVATLWGPVIGAFLLGPLSEVSRGLLRGYPGIDVMLYGMILVAVLIFMPSGVIGWFKKDLMRRQGFELLIRGKQRIAERLSGH
jgi:branched-chain amino acid transport system permease protein